MHPKFGLLALHKMFNPALLGTEGKCAHSFLSIFELHFLGYFSIFRVLAHIIRKSEAMATQQAQNEDNWSQDERAMSEYTPVNSDDNEDFDSEPDFDQLDAEGPLAPPPGPGDTLYEGPFDSLEAVYEWCQEWAGSRGYSLRKNQIKKKNDRPVRQYFDCDRGGAAVRTTVPLTLRRRPDTATKKTGCTFRCAATGGDGRWDIHTVTGRGVHNHDSSLRPASHPAIRRIWRKTHPDEVKRIQSDLAAGVEARKIYRSLLYRYPELPITLKDIWNLSSAYKSILNQGLPPIQAMIAEMGHSQRFRFLYTLNEQDRVERCLFFSVEGTNLLQLYPSTVVLDCTYKTNRFNLPLLNLVGVTATNSSFIIGQGFLSFEKNEDFIWVLNHLKTLYEELDLGLPISISTDKDAACIKALGEVFPTVAWHLCVWHIHTSRSAMGDVLRRLEGCTLR